MSLEEIIKSLEADDNKALHHIYIAHGDYCLKQLIANRNCSVEEAEDFFIESVMIFREKILSKEISQVTSLRHYLYKICENKFLAKLKVEKSRAGKISEIEWFFYSSNYSSDEDWDEDLSQAAKHSFQALSEKCKDIIYYFYVDKIRMEEIAEIMGLANADVAKTTKARCYKSLITAANNFYTKMEKSNAIK